MKKEKSGVFQIPDEILDEPRGIQERFIEYQKICILLKTKDPIQKIEKLIEENEIMRERIVKLEKNLSK